MDTLKIGKLGKLTYTQQLSSKLVLGTYAVTKKQPLIKPSNVGTLPHGYTHPLINIKNSNLSVIRVFLRYRSIKVNQALKSPKIRRPLKPVATSSVSAVLLANPLSRSNCRTNYKTHRTCRTYILQIRNAQNFLDTTNTEYEE